MEKQLLHLLTLTLLSSISRATGDLCYMVPALLASFKNSLAVLVYGLFAFLLTTFFEIVVFVNIILYKKQYGGGTKIVSPPLVKHLSAETFRLYQRCSL